MILRSGVERTEEQRPSLMLVGRAANVLVGRSAHAESPIDVTASPLMRLSLSMNSEISSSNLDASNSTNVQAAKAIRWTVPTHYRIPRSVVAKSLEEMDSKDSPDKPGMMLETTLRDMVTRFDKVFGRDKINEARGQARAAEMTDMIEHLRKHTRRRRGDEVLEHGLLEWEQTSRIYDVFTMNLNTFEKVFFTVDVGETTSVLSKIISFFLIFMIITSIVLWMISTIPDLSSIPAGCVTQKIGECSPQPSDVFKTSEKICVLIFTVEYAIRILSVHSVRFALLDEEFLHRVLVGPGVKSQSCQEVTISANYSDFLESDGTSVSLELDGPIYTTVKYVLGYSNLIDLFAILPYWIEAITGSSGDSGALMVIRILRLTRVFRVFRLGKYNDVFNLFARVIAKSTPALSLMLFFISLDCCLFGSLMWFLEQGTWYPKGHHELILLNITGRGAYLRRDGTVADNLEETPFHSIIHAFWFVIVTISTVGYGDLVPKTPGGKFVGAVTILTGIVLLAMPIGVVGNNFSVEYYKDIAERKRRQRMKEKNDEREYLERHQDVVVDELEASEAAGVQSAVALETLRIDVTRQKLLSEAEKMDQHLEAALPATDYDRLSQEFLRFLSNFLSPNDQACSTVTARPVISVASLEDLDSLEQVIHSALASAMSVDLADDFNIRRVHTCRRAWAVFVQRCWIYAMSLCRVERLSEPPEYFHLKASLTRIKDAELPPPRHSISELPQPSGKVESARNFERISIDSINVDSMNAHI